MHFPLFIFMFSYIFHELFHEIHELIHKFHLQYSYSSWNNKVLLLGQIERQALKAPSKPAYRFLIFFIARPLFFPDFGGAFFSQPSFFFLFVNFWSSFFSGGRIKKKKYKRPLFQGEKRSIIQIFFLCALFPPSFIFFSPVLLSRLVFTSLGTH